MVPQAVALEMFADSRLFMYPSIPYEPKQGKDIIVLPAV